MFRLGLAHCGLGSFEGKSAIGQGRLGCLEGPCLMGFARKGCLKALGQGPERPHFSPDACHLGLEVPNSAVPQPGGRHKLGQLQALEVVDQFAFESGKGRWRGGGAPR